MNSPLLGSASQGKTMGLRRNPSIPHSLLQCNISAPDDWGSPSCIWLRLAGVQPDGGSHAAAATQSELVAPVRKEP